MIAPERPLPDPDDPLTAPFWAAARENRLVAQRCTDCHYRRWPPAPVCYACQSSNAIWVGLSGRGTLYSYAEYHRALDPSFAAEVPYTVALIELPEGPWMYGKILDTLQTSDIGRPVVAVYEAVTPRVTLVRWQLDTASDD